MKKSVLYGLMISLFLVCVTAYAEEETGTVTSDVVLTTKDYVDEGLKSVYNTVKEYTTAVATGASQATTSVSNRVTVLENAVNHETTGLNTKASQSDLNTLNNRVTELQNATNNLLQGSYATKAGVTETISNTTVSGSVPVVTAWGDESASSLTITTTVNAAEYSEPEDED